MYSGFGSTAPSFGAPAATPGFGNTGGLSGGTHSDALVVRALVFPSLFRPRPFPSLPPSRPALPPSPVSPPSLLRPFPSLPLLTPRFPRLMPLLFVPIDPPQGSAKRAALERRRATPSVARRRSPRARSALVPRPSAAAWVRVFPRLLLTTARSFSLSPKPSFLSHRH